jgi:regulator of sigma E protease
LTTIIAFVLILSLLIFVHELGHFIVAKRSGITVEEFAIGFPPRVWKLWQDEGKITLDGQEYILGRRLNIPRSIEPGTRIFAETSVDAKGRPTVVYMELADQPVQSEQTSTGTKNSESRFFDTLRVGEGGIPTTQPESDRRTFYVDTLIRPTEYSINLIPLGGYVRMVGEEDPTAPGSFASKSKRVRLAVLAAGSLMNLVLAVVFFTLTSMSGVPEPVTGTNLAGEEAPIADTVITQVVEDTPASQVGLEVGDKVVGADGIDFNHIGDLIYYVNGNKGNEITLHVQRGGVDGQSFDAALTPRINPPEGQGAMGVGISYENLENEKTYYPLHTAMFRGVTQTAEYIGLVFYMPIAILRDVIPAEAARPTGPVGIYQQTDSAVNAAVQLDWWFPILWLTAILSTALAVTNLLPLPALDGGRILFIIVEALRGKRIAPEKEGAIHFIGLALLLTLMLVISYYDVSNPIPKIDWADFF